MSRFIVRLQDRPLRFPEVGRPVLYECVASDGEATGFESAEEAVKCLHKRGLAASRVRIVEVPEVPEESGKPRMDTKEHEGGVS